jgi:hypothetical protein
MLETELQHRARNVMAVIRADPEVTISPKAAELLTRAVHEFAASSPWMRKAPNANSSFP